MKVRRDGAGTIGSVLLGLLLGGAGVGSFPISEAVGPVPVSRVDNGQRIFQFGTTADGRMVQNSHGMQGVGCAMCHGQDGRGGMMHGIPVPNITFSILTDPRGYRNPSGRTRPAYNQETVKAAIVAGIDAGGNTLHPEMPRWTGLTAQDLDDLIGYLRTLGQGERRAPSASEGL